MDTRSQSATRPGNTGKTSLDAKVDALAKSAHEAVDRSAQALHEATDSLAAVDNFAREKPLQAIGLATLAGFLLARVGGR